MSRRLSLEHHALATPASHQTSVEGKAAEIVLTEADVRDFYRLLLDREVENEETLSMKTGRSLSLVIMEFITSQEFCVIHREYLTSLFS